MTNKQIAKTFQYLAKLMELHGGNPFKVKSFNNAYINIRKLPNELADMKVGEIESIQGIGKSMVEKILELRHAGTLEDIAYYEEKTPEGIREMLQVKGLGPKKIKMVWDEMGIMTVGDLLYACNENRLVGLKGFGAKTQEKLSQQLNYYIQSKGKSHYASIATTAEAIIDFLQEKFPQSRHSLCGEIRRKMTVIEDIEILSTQNLEEIYHSLREHSTLVEEVEGKLKVQGHEIKLFHSNDENFGYQLMHCTGPQSYLDALGEISGDQSQEDDLVLEKGILLPPELRDNKHFYGAKAIPELITNEDIKGVVHNHSTWSDGVNSIKEMAQECIRLGYEYLVMSDHSKSAFYANGLDEDRVLAQMEEIDQLNDQLDGFRIYKSIESDILNGGALDYDDDILELFDLVIASIHTNLTMDKEKATRRLITAIENPYTSILGHPTGRLLLSREGYPMDAKRIIDACAENEVAIELNANPYRLDLDWRHIHYAMENDVMISINPDAHSIAGIQDIKYGVIAARKGGLSAAHCLNAMSASEFDSWVASLKF